MPIEKRINKKQKKAIHKIQNIMQELSFCDAPLILFNVEDDAHQRFWSYLDTSCGYNLIQSILSEANLPKWEFCCERSLYPNSANWNTEEYITRKIMRTFGAPDEWNKEDILQFQIEALADLISEVFESLKNFFEFYEIFS